MNNIINENTHNLLDMKYLSYPHIHQYLLVSE